MGELIHVTAAAVIGDHRLRLTFEDGTIGDVDFSDRDWLGVFAPLGDPVYFGSVAVDAQAGTVVWPNGADMAPEKLYEAARRHRIVA